MILKKIISSVALNTPEPYRAERNLERFFCVVKDKDFFLSYIKEIALLFSHSQFLANYSIKFPQNVIVAINSMEIPINSEELIKEIENKEIMKMEENEFMKWLRLFKKKILLRLTLRYITKRSDIVHSMEELSRVAEVIVKIALSKAIQICKKRYGEPSTTSFISIVALGKLGAEELNYSSDIDIIAVHPSSKGQTSGIVSPSGIRLNKIDNHEFFCKVMEILNKILSIHTEDGFVYRVDLRLRPQGQRSPIAIPIEAYRAYYESWARTWEKMVLIRARYIAGDINTFNEFKDIIQSFLWRRTLDHVEFTEIRTMKKKIDFNITKDDIKRGYGGIREVEFFINTLQLIYGIEEKALRTHRLSKAINVLRKMGIVPEEELYSLWQNYLFLRKIENYLQMKDDIQTHTLPKDENQLKSLALKMGFINKEKFLSELKVRRTQINEMYNDLLGTAKDVQSETLNLIEGDFTEKELTYYLSKKKLKDPTKIAKSIQSIKEQLGIHRTLRERSLFRRVVPYMLQLAFQECHPNRAILGIEKFLKNFGSKEVYLSWLDEQREFMKGIVKLLSISKYLSRIFLSDKIYFSLLIEDPSVRKSLFYMKKQISRYLKQKGNLSDLLVEYRKAEEFRLGLFFLLNTLSTPDLLRCLSHVAEAIIDSINKKNKVPMGIIAMGKLGGREMTYGSDIDIIFVSDTEDGVKCAESVIKTLTTYTNKGFIYNVDVRLRPNGSKGVLVKNILDYKNYYLKHAQNWEIQALLKARPVSISSAFKHLTKEFMSMVKDVLLKRANEISWKEISSMREKIVKELTQEKGIDIKFAPGGIEDIEFYIQWLQLKNISKNTSLLVQNTMTALNRLYKASVIELEFKNKIYKAYNYYRKVETFLKLNDVHVLEDPELIEIGTKFMNHKNSEEFIFYIKKLKKQVIDLIEKDVIKRG